MLTKLRTLVPLLFAGVASAFLKSFPLINKIDFSPLAYQGSEEMGDIFQKKQDFWKEAKEQKSPTMLDNRFITEKTSEIDSGKLSTQDASNYGICALLAQEHLWLNNLKEAEEKAKEAMEAATAHTKGQDNVYQAYAEGILGEVQFAEGNYKEAALHFHNALGIYERHERTSTGPESVMLVAATQLVSWVSLAKNESSIEAQVFARTALAMTERLLGPNHVDTAACMVNLAVANSQVNDYGKGSEGLLKRAIEIYDLNLNLCGSDSSIDMNTDKMLKGKMNALSLLGHVYLHNGLWERAKRIFHSVIDMYNAGLVDGKDVVDDFRVLVDLYMKQDDIVRAQLYYTKAIELLEKDERYGISHPKTLELKEFLLSI